MLQRVGLRRKLFFAPSAPATHGRDEAPLSQIKPLFVYGTLRRGQPNHELNIPSPATVEEDVKMVGGLYHWQGMPIALSREELEDAGIGSESGYVHGDLIFLPDDIHGENLLRRLDALEGFSPDNPEKGKYLRKLVRVFRGDGTEIEAWVYVAPPAQVKALISDGKRIADGDWVKLLGSVKSGESLPLYTWERELMARRTALLSKAQIHYDPATDWKLDAEISRLIEQEKFHEAESHIYSLQKSGLGKKRLGRLIHKWVDGQKSRLNPNIVLVHEDQPDYFDAAALRRVLGMIQLGAESAFFSRRMLNDLLEMLENLESSSVVGDSTRNQIRQTIASLISAQRIPEPRIRSILERWKQKVAQSQYRSERDLEGLAFILTSGLIYKKYAREAGEAAGIFADLAFSHSIKNDLTRIKIIESLIQLSEIIPLDEKKRIACGFFSHIAGLHPPQVRTAAARAYLRLMGAASFDLLVPALTGREAPANPRTDSREVYRALLESREFDQFAVAIDTLAVAGHEAVDYAQKNFELPPPLDRIVFLEAALMAGRGRTPRQIAQRINYVVSLRRRRDREVSQRLGPFALSTGFEIEAWPKGFEPKSNANVAAGQRYGKVLGAFGLWTSKDGFGEFASHPSRSLETQVHLLVLLARLGLFSHRLAYSLHINFGLPFEVPFYPKPAKVKDDGEPPAPPQHPGLYRALANSWFPLGFLHASDVRWDNMLAQDEIQSILHPIRFYNKNVLLDGQSRLEHRLFEVNLLWGRMDFMNFMLALHHFSYAALWKELAEQQGTRSDQEKFRLIGRIWSQHERQIREFRRGHGLSIPNYFASDRGAKERQRGFQEKIKRIRRENPASSAALRKIVRQTFRALEAVMRYRPNHSLVLPRPIITDPRQGIV